MGILQKNIPSFSHFGKKSQKLKTLLHVGLNHIFQIKVCQKFANNKNTSGEDICPTSAWTFISRACPIH
jgi:hypothetical protein